MLFRGPPRTLRTASVNPSETASDAVLAPRCRLWVLLRNTPPPDTLFNTVPVPLGERRTCHSVGLSHCSHRLSCRESWSLTTRLPRLRRFPGPLTNFVHAESRLGAVKIGLWGRNLLHPFTIVEVAAASSVNSPCPPPGTRSATYPSVCTPSPRRSSARDFASSNHFHHIGKSGAPYSFLATFHCLAPVLSPPALILTARS